ncbi:hypothetical protein KUF71_007154 [Frankliniella fusca]|uniref:Uncharacterized protein n=1 Tax=Frankliniella fusca TaxID=407009 RepID=A0AAE1LGZ4_9NEOP|nr:hypothetical protein KUF71_007154 [Frankliniella fusca]
MLRSTAMASRSRPCEMRNLGVSGRRSARKAQSRVGAAMSDSMTRHELKVTPRRGARSCHGCGSTSHATPGSSSHDTVQKPPTMREGIRGGKGLSTARLGQADLQALVGALVAEVGVGALLHHLGPVAGSGAVGNAVEVDLLLELLGGVALRVAGGLGLQGEAELAVVLDDLDAVGGAVTGGLLGGAGALAAGALAVGVLVVAGVLVAGVLVAGALLGLVAAGLSIADGVTNHDNLAVAGGLLGLLLLLANIARGVDGPGGRELLGLAEDAVGGGGEVAGLLAVEGTAKTADLVAVAVGGAEDDAGTVVKDLNLVLGGDHLDGVGQGVELGEDVAVLVLDLGDVAAGDADGAAVDLDGSAVAAAGGGHLDDVVAEDNLDLLLVVGAGVADEHAHRVGSVLLARAGAAGVSVLLGDGLHHDVPVVAEVQGVGGVHRVKSGNLANALVDADVVELSAHVGGVDGQVGGLQVGGEAELELNLVVVGVLGVDEVLGVVLPAEVTGGVVGLVGGVLDKVGDLLEANLDLVQVEEVGGVGGVLAGGESEVALLHLLLAHQGHGLAADLLAAGRGLLHLAVDVDLGGGGVELLTEVDLALEGAVGLSLQGLQEVDGGNVGHLGGSGQGKLHLLGAGGVTAQVDEDAGLVIDGGVGDGGGGDELGLGLAVELGGQVQDGGASALDTGGNATEELLLALLAVDRVARGVGKVLAGTGLLLAEVGDGLVGVAVVRVVVGALGLLGVLALALLVRGVVPLVGVVLIVLVVVVGSSEGHAVGGGLLGLVGDGVLVGLDALLGRGHGQGGDGTALLESLHGGGVGAAVHLGGGVDAESHTSHVLADGEVGHLGLADLDGLLVNGAQVQDVVLGGVGAGSSQENLGFLVGLDGLQLDADLSVLEVEVHVGADGQIDLQVLVKTSDKAVVVEGGDETHLGLELSGVQELDVSGSVDSLGDADVVLGAVGDVGLGADASLTTDGQQRGGLQLVHEGQTHGGGEAHGDGQLVVQLGVVEVLAGAERVGGLLHQLGKLLDGVVVDGEEALLAKKVDEQVSLNLGGLVGLDVQHVGDLLSGPLGVGGRGGALAVVLGLLGLGGLPLVGEQVVGGGLDGGLDDSAHLVAGVLVGELSHTLEHAGGRVGLHQQVDSDATDLVGLTSVLVKTEEDGAGDLRRDLGELVESGDHVEALELGDALLALEVRLENGQDLGVGSVAEGTDVHLGLVAVLVLDGILELLGQVGDVITGDSGGLLGVQATEDVGGVTVVGGRVVDLSLADQVGEGEDSGDVQELLLLDLGLLDQIEEGVHVLLGGHAGGHGEGGDDLGGLLTLDLVVLDPLLDELEGGASAGLSDGVTESLPGGNLLGGALAVAGALGGGGDVQVVAGLLKLLSVHGADQAGQDGELGKGVLLGDLVGVLDLVGNLLAELLNGLDSVDLAGSLDGGAHVADKLVLELELELELSESLELELEEEEEEELLELELLELELLGLVLLWLRFWWPWAGDSSLEEELEKMKNQHF